MSRNWLEKLVVAHARGACRVVGRAAAARRGMLGHSGRRLFRLRLLGAAPASAAATGAVGAGQVKVALILPLQRPGQCRRDRAVDAQRRRDGARRIQQSRYPAAGEGRRRQSGRARSRRPSRRSSEGAEIILGPLFAQSVRAAGQIARQRGVPIIAFSTDAGVAASGVYLLSFLPESEVDRVIGYAMSSRASARSRRSFRTMPTAPWCRPRSSRRSRAAAAASS